MKRIKIGIAISLFALMIMPLASRISVAAAVTIVIPDDYASIQEGIDAAVSGDTVLVRDGTYMLDTAIDFKGKAILVRSENGASSCILDGQSTDSVLYFHSGEGNESVLQGFTIRNGKAQMGGGIRLESSSPTITGCIISSNLAYKSTGKYQNPDAYGGGIYCNGSSPKILNCKIAGNQVQVLQDGSYTPGYGARGGQSYGAGIYMNGGSPQILDCLIDGNKTAISNPNNTKGGTHAWGGGIYSTASSPSIINTAISNNSAYVSDTSQGGGIYFATASPIMINCIVSGNSAKDGGGVYFEESSAFSNLTNCTIVRNTATTNGGGMYCNSTSPKIINSILWENSPQEVYNEGTSNPTITFSAVYGGYTGTGNIDASPLFVSTAQGDYHLRSASPVINAGTNAAPELPGRDKGGSDRIIDGVVDMGAYEYSSELSSDVIVYPQLAVGGGYEVVLIVNNKSDSSWSGKVKPLLNDGSLDYLSTQLQLDPGETRKFTLTGDSTIRTTGLEIYGDSGHPNSAVSVAYFFNFFQDDHLQDSTGVPKGQLAKKFTFPVERSSTIDTGLAIRRRAHQPDSPITLTLLDINGSPIQQVDSGSDFAKFFTELFAGVPSQFIGSVVAESPDDFYLVVIRLENTQPGFQLTSVPAEAD